MTTVTFVTNPVAGGWHPDDLATFLGGNEECLLLLSHALARAGVAVTVYTTLRQPVTADPYGVTWRDLATFDPAAPCDVFVSWKNRQVWDLPIRARRTLHASQDVEPMLPLRMDYVLTLGSYHASRLPWAPQSMQRRVPLGIDTAHYRPLADDGPREPLALYATSPDRGLEIVLRDWPTIRAAHGDALRLLITYDWTRLETMSGPQGAAYAAHLTRLADQPGIARRCVTAAEMVEVFQRARYYLHPLPRPDADLFGFGALKAASCGATLVLPSSLHSGFADTVRAWVPYEAFCRGETVPQPNPGWCQPAQDWDEIVAAYWMPLLEGR